MPAFPSRLVSKINGNGTSGNAEEDKTDYETAAIFESIFELGKKLLYEDEGIEALNYLTTVRGYDREILKQTEWIYVPPDGSIKKYLHRELSLPKEQIDSLPSFKSKHGFICALPYRNRHEIITGFILRNQDTNNADRRWDSSKGTDKTDLFGLYKCKGMSEVVIVEGYPDAAIFPALGMSNVVAIGQGRLSESHIEGLKAFGITSVVISFDNDASGPENTLAAIELLKDSGISARIVLPEWLGNYKDPDELVRAKGIDAFKELVKRAESPEAAGIKLDAWPDVAPFDQYSNLPDFPLDILPPDFREMATEVQRVIQVDSGAAVRCIAQTGTEEAVI